jgi:uncharacterized protein (TIGR00297 family)
VLLDPELLHMCGMIALFGVCFIGSNAIFRKKFSFSLSLLLSAAVTVLVVFGLDGFDLSGYTTQTSGLLSSIFRRGHIYSIVLGLSGIIIAVPLSRRMSSQAYRSLFHMMVGTVLLLFILPGEEFALVALTGILVILSFAEYFRIRENNALSKFAESLFSPAFRGDEAMGFLASFFYLLGIFLVVLFLPKPMAMASISILAFGDPSATIIGKKFGRTKWSTNRNKSIEGSIAMLMVSVMILFLFHTFYGLEVGFLTVILVAISVTIVEALPLRIGDNILIPLFAGMIMAASTNVQAMPVQWFSLLIVLGLIIYYMRFLDLFATFIAIFFGFLILLASKPAFLIALLDFLVLGYMISKMGYEEKRRKNVAEKRSGMRTINPVIANGIVPTFFSLVYVLDPRASVLLFTGAVAGAMGDVFATEVGCLGDKFYKIFSMDRARVGDRGAISLLGEFGCIAGSALIGLILAFLFDDYRLVFFALLSGFIGSNMDSALNSFVPNITKSETNVLATLTSGIILLLFY